MTIRQLKLLNEICAHLGVTVDYFINPKTGVANTNLADFVQLRMSTMSIFSMSELGRRMGLEVPGQAAQIVKQLDAQATKDNIQFEKAARQPLLRGAFDQKNRP